MARSLTDDDVAAIADQVVDKLAARFGHPDQLMSTSTVAGLLAVSEHWVWAHAVDLGAIRIGGGRGALRFDRRHVLRELERRRLQHPPRDKPRRRPGPKPKPRTPEGVPLLPIPGKEN
jgi:hypothetical protein